ncbi:MAG: hypothetical protein NZ853_04390 [Leptospiraceae bacterium]|nr:hypothetical protein [Leptospiraceae bacterium]MDW7975413.1 hypothetical protein [Leptospiraceae bacterium]
MRKYIKFILSFLFICWNSFLLGISYEEIQYSQFQSLILMIGKDKIYTHLEKKSQSLGIVTVVGVIRAPIDVVWRTINSDDKKLYPEFLYKEVKKISENILVKKALLDFPWPFENRWTIYREKLDPKIYAKEWYEIGGDIKVNRGAVRLFSLNPEETVMVFKSQFDPGIGIVPIWAIEMGMKYKAPSIIQKIRDYLKNNPHKGEGKN